MRKFFAKDSLKMFFAKVLCEGFPEKVLYEGFPEKVLYEKCRTAVVCGISFMFISCSTMLGC